MCGLFGAIAPTGATCDPKLLTMAATRAAVRGPHAHGIAYLAQQTGPQRPVVRVERERGPLTDAALRRLTERATQTPIAAIIGQARLATSGTYLQPGNNQPLLVKGIAVAHNGNVYNAAELARAHGLTLGTGNDSEVIASLVALLREKSGLSLAEAVRRTVALLDPRAPLALLVLDSTGLVAARRSSADRPGHPLYSVTQDGVTYLSSRMSEGAALLSDDALAAWQWTFAGALARGSLPLTSSTPSASIPAAILN